MNVESRTASPFGIIAFQAALAGIVTDYVNQSQYTSIIVLLKGNQKHRSDRIISIHHCLVPCTIKPVKHDLACRSGTQITTTHDVLKTHRLITRRTRPHFGKFVHGVNVSQDNFCQKHYFAVWRIASRPANYIGHVSTAKIIDTSHTYLFDADDV